MPLLLTAAGPSADRVPWECLSLSDTEIGMPHTVGSSADATVRIDCPLITGIHAEIWFDPIRGEWKIRDRALMGNQTNGVFFCNEDSEWGDTVGERILRHNDAFSLGRETGVYFKVHLPDVLALQKELAAERDLHRAAEAHLQAELATERDLRRAAEALLRREKRRRTED